MKTAISTFVKEHPVMSFLLADIIVKQGMKTIRVILRGYPEPDTKIVYQGDSSEEELEGNEESPVT